jgi:hypothetical protein
MEGFDEELPDFGHRFESAASERIGIGGDAAPADDAQPLGVGGGFDAGAGFGNFRRRKKGKSNGEQLGQPNSLLLSAGAKEGLWERCEQTGAIAAGAIRIHSTAVSEPL